MEVAPFVHIVFQEKAAVNFTFSSHTSTDDDIGAANFIGARESRHQGGKSWRRIVPRSPTLLVNIVVAACTVVVATTTCDVIAIVTIIPSLSYGHNEP